MMIRSFLRASAATQSVKQTTSRLIPIFHSNYSSKAPTPKPGGSKKPKPSKFDPFNKRPISNDESQSSSSEPLFSSKQESELRSRQLVDDDKNPALNVGPNGRPLFTTARSISSLTENDVNTYFNFSKDELRKSLPEGLPMGMVKEFEESSREALLVRQSFLHLRDNFMRATDPSLVVNTKAPKVRKQVVLDGLASCGKSIALGMLVHWARSEGWLVFYVPRGQDWTHGGLYYKNHQTGLWDTPVHAANILNDFLKYNKTLLQGLICTIHDPIQLGEGAGVGLPKGNDKMEISEDMSLFQLVGAGINNTHAAVGVLVRLRQELSNITSVPVLIAIDQYNSWFTFTDFEEPVTVRSCKAVHARELSTVNAFRSMMHGEMMVGAFSQSTAVGKLRLELPDVPTDARLNLPRYSLDEAATVCHYYLRQRLVKRDAFSDQNWKKIFFLSNGNGTEMRYLVPFMR